MFRGQQKPSTADLRSGGSPGLRWAPRSQVGPPVSGGSPGLRWVPPVSGGPVRGAGRRRWEEEVQEEEQRPGAAVGAASTWTDVTDVTDVSDELLTAHSAV